MAPNDNYGRMVSFNNLDGEIQKLLEDSVKVRELAYCPYSNFKVGAALLTNKGTSYTGCNVENASFGGAICAERSAFVNAVSSGDLDFKAIAVCADSVQGILAPCGLCREFIAEFSDSIKIYLTNSLMEKVREISISEILPSI